jgi:hypothetical protein
VFLARGRHGHYVVLRPVGHTGKLVQVLDPNEEPVVLDAARLYASPEWTGLALVPARPNWTARVVGTIGAAALAVLGVARLARRRRGATGGATAAGLTDAAPAG